MDAAVKTLRIATVVVACVLLAGGERIAGVAARGDRAAANATHSASLQSASRPTRIVSIVPAVTEMLFAIGAGASVAGVSSYDHFPADVERLPKVGALLDPDFEKILSLRPDLVVVYNSQTDFIARLQKAGIPMFPYEHAGLTEITGTMRRLGTRIGRAADAERAARGIEAELDAVHRRVARYPAVRTLLIFGREPGELRGIYASAGVGFLHDLLVLAGGADVFGNLARQSVQISSEQVLARAPDAIIELHEHASTPEKLDAEQRVWLQLPGVPAVRNHRVYLLTGEFLTSPGPRVAQAARLFADALHPEAGRRPVPAIIITRPGAGQ